MPPANGLEIPCRGGVHRSRINYIPGVQASHRKRDRGLDQGSLFRIPRRPLPPFPEVQPSSNASAFGPQAARRRKSGHIGEAISRFRDMRPAIRKGIPARAGTRDAARTRNGGGRLLATSYPGDRVPWSICEGASPGGPQGRDSSCDLLIPSLARRSGKEDGAAGNRPAVHDRYRNFNS